MANPNIAMVRVFIGLALHNQIMTYSIRVERHMALDPSCPCCTQQEETLIHLTRECVLSKQIWLNIGIPYSRRQS